MAFGLRPTNVVRRICLTMVLHLATAGVVVPSLLRAQDISSPGDAKPVVDAVVQQNIDDWVMQGRGLADDWTHHHLVFSNPGTAEQAMDNGTFERWLKVTKHLEGHKSGTNE